MIGYVGCAGLVVLKFSRRGERLDLNTDASSTNVSTQATKQNVVRGVRDHTRNNPSNLNSRIQKQRQSLHTLQPPLPHRPPQPLNLPPPIPPHPPNLPTHPRQLPHQLRLS